MVVKIILGFSQYRQETPVTFTAKSSNSGQNYISSNFSNLSIDDCKRK